MATPADAEALAGLAPWLPGCLQMNHHAGEAMLLDLIDNFEARASGNAVTLSGAVADEKVRETARAVRLEQEERDKQMGTIVYP